MAYSKPTISGYNSNPPPDDGTNSSLNEITWAKHKVKLGDPLKTYADAINDAAETQFTAVDSAKANKIASPTTGNLVSMDENGDIQDAGVAAADVLSTSDAATQAEQETGTATTVYTSPGTQQYHPSAAKAWVNFTGTGTVTINSSYNVSSITDSGTGQYVVNYSTAMADTLSTILVSGSRLYAGFSASNANAFGMAATQTGGSCSVQWTTTAPAFEDPARMFVGVFGDL